MQQFLVYDVVTGANLNDSISIIPFKKTTLCIVNISYENHKGPHQSLMHLERKICNAYQLLNMQRSSNEMNLCIHYQVHTNYTSVIGVLVSLHNIGVNQLKVCMGRYQPA